MIEKKKIVHIKNITPTSVDTENENCVLLGNYVGSSGNYVASSGNSIYIAAEVWNNDTKKSRVLYTQRADTRQAPASHIA